MFVVLLSERFFFTFKFALNIITCNFLALYGKLLRRVMSFDYLMYFLYAHRKMKGILNLHIVIKQKSVYKSVKK